MQRTLALIAVLLATISCAATTPPAERTQQSERTAPPVLASGSIPPRSTAPGTDFLPGNPSTAASPLDCGPRGEAQNYRIEDTFAISRTNPALMYLAVEWLGVFRSLDGGASWTATSKGITAYPRRDDPTCPCYQEFGTLVIDPTDDRHVLVSRVEGGGTLRDRFTENAGVWETDDRGLTWRQLLTEGMNAGGGWSLAMSASDPRTIFYGSPYLPASYAGADPNRRFNTRGVLHRTNDGGRTWEELPTGLVDQLRAGRVSVDGDRVFLATAAFLQGRSAPRQLGPLRSLDGGRTWTSLADRLPEGYRAVLDAWVAPTEPRHIYMSPANFDGQRQYGFASLDGGDTWARSNGPFVARFDPLDPAGLRLIGLSYGGAVQRSDDGGATWREVGRAPAEATTNLNRVTTVVFDPQRVGVVYLGASGPIIWRSPDGGATWSVFLTRDRLPVP